MSYSAKARDAQRAARSMAERVALAPPLPPWLRDGVQLCCFARDYGLDPFDAAQLVNLTRLYVMACEAGDRATEPAAVSRAANRAAHYRETLTEYAGKLALGIQWHHPPKPPTLIRRDNTDLVLPPGLLRRTPRRTRIR